MSLRIDKFIWHVRLAKTRSIATEWVQKGKIKLNNSTVKPSKEVQLNDRIQFSIGNAVFCYQIIAFSNNRVGAKLVNDFIVDLTSKEEIEKYQLYIESKHHYREHGNFKPTRKERNEIESFLEGLE